MDKSSLAKGATLGCIAVIFGALGAHALKEVLLPEQLLSFETGVRYQMYHALAIIVLAVVVKNKSSKLLVTAVNLFFWGVILFSGSIYLLTLKTILAADFLKFVGPITPIGGIILVFGWILLIWEGVRG
ncbi:MAG: DUF423 domain-containing protein [Flavobacteriales bacterium]|nr:DUF423 domain-containing protein [Flavobacteriales bacterium]MBX2960119.1 DUF423 domain-containing protein [Flavobacteriales bacterium]MCL4856814.1 DUF423 domain-containing protein [Flavobacteriales bacterium]